MWLIYLIHGQSSIPNIAILRNGAASCLLINPRGRWCIGTDRVGCFWRRSICLWRRASQFCGILSFRLGSRSNHRSGGPYWSGKSSIMNPLLSFCDPQEGGGFDRWSRYSPSFSRESLRSHMGIVLDPYLFTGTIASNVAMNQDHIDRDAVQDALKSRGLVLVSALKGNRPSSVVEKDPPFSRWAPLISFARTLYMNPANSGFGWQFLTSIRKQKKSSNRLWQVLVKGSIPLSCSSLVHHPRCGSDLSFIRRTIVER